MGTILGESALLLFCFLSVGIISKFFPLRADPLIQGFPYTEKQTGSDEGCLFLKKNGGGEEKEVYPYTLYDLLTQCSESSLCFGLDPLYTGRLFHC